MENLTYEQTLHEKYLKAVEQLNTWSKYYYVYDNPMATDEEYDKLNNTIKEYEKLYPWKIVLHSPTQRIYPSLLKKFDKAKHITNMWSLEDIFNLEEFTVWYNRIISKYTSVTFYCQPKFDGLSLNLIYENGYLKQAITRGNGIEGEDVTINARTIKNIPLSIEIKDRIEVKGEVVIKKEDFDLLNQERLKNNEPLFANPRNTAAGSLRQLDPTITASRNLHFIAWGVGEHSFDDSNSFWLTMSILRNLGFSIRKISEKENVKTLEEIYKEYNTLLNNRNDIDVELDGMVVKVDELSLYEEIGYTAKFPKWACAFKFPALEKSTKIKKVEYQIGKTGVITPVAILEPIDLAGVTVEKVVLHNFSYIKSKDIKIGDQVVVIRSGDVIPKITSVFTDRRNGKEKDIKVPEKCPCCKSELTQENVYLKCTNRWCFDKIVAYISDFASKDNLNIVGLSEGIIRQLVKKKLIYSPIHLYKLTYDELIKLDGFQDKKANNLLSAIENSKHPSMDRVIHSLNINGIGKGVSKLIASVLNKPMDIIDISRKTLINLPGVGSVLTDSIIDYVDKEEEYIWHLVTILKPYIQVELPKVSGILNNKVFAITGKFDISRKDIISKIKSKGGEFSDSVNKNVNYLIAGENPSDKINKANKLNIGIIKLEDLDNDSWL